MVESYIGFSWVSRNDTGSFGSKQQKQCHWFVLSQLAKTFVIVWTLYTKTLDIIILICVYLVDLQVDLSPLKISFTKILLGIIIGQVKKQQRKLISHYLPKLRNVITNNDIIHFFSPSKFFSLSIFIIWWSNLLAI